MIQRIPVCKPIVFRSDRAGTVGMIEYDAYRADIASRLPLPATQAPLYLRLHVAVPTAANLLVLYDVENYLTHLVLLLGAERIVLAHATKAVGGESWAELGLAKEAGTSNMADAFPPFAAASATGFKPTMRQHLIDSGAAVLSQGPVGLRMAFRTSPPRNWANLSKPAGAVLEPVLGRTDRRGANPFDPQDDRIVDLELHHTLDPELGYAFQIGLEVWSV